MATAVSSADARVRELEHDSGRGRRAALRDRVTAICLALPEVTVDDGHHPHRGFKVAGKNLGWFTVNEHGSGRIALVVRAEAKENEALVASDPERFELPKYVARHGYVSYFLDLPTAPSTGPRSPSCSATATASRRRSASSASSTTDPRAGG